MREFKLLDLYESTNDEIKENFLDNIDARLQVQNKYRKVIFDYSWLEKMEETMNYLDNIIRNPKKFIINEEEVVKIEKARKVTVESIRHLTQHTSYIQQYDQHTGEVKPSKILNINKEESFDLYENRFIYTLLINMKMFISRVGGSSENGSSIKIDLNSSNNKNLTSTNNLGLSVSQRIEKIKMQLADFTNSDFIKDIERANVSLVRSPIKKTNIILKNPNFQKAVELWNFLESYDFDNFQEENIDNEYEDTSDFRNNMNDSFLIDYIVLNNVLDNDKNKEELYKLNKYYITKIIKDFVDNNNNYDEKAFIKMLKEEFKEVKKVKTIKLNRIRNIYQKDIEKYLKIKKECINILGR